MKGESHLLPFGFEALLDALDEAVIVHDLDDRVLYWNRAAEALYGWPGDEIIGRSLQRIFNQDEAAHDEQRCALEEKGRWSGVQHHIDRQGADRVIRVRQRLYRSEDGWALAIICQNSEVVAVDDEADEGRGIRSIVSTRLLAGGVAHEVNNALAPIMLSAAMLRRQVESEKASGLVSMIEKSARKASELFHEVLDFERGIGGGYEVISKTKILRAIQRAKDAVVPGCVTVDTHLADDLHQFFGNASELTEIFKHIMQNACEAMPDGGSLEIFAVNEYCDEAFVRAVPDAVMGGHVSIGFRDSGGGIHSGIIDRVAEPFFTTKQPKQGYGHGLTKSQALMKGHHGFITLMSEAGKGATITVHFPAKESEVFAGLDRYDHVDNKRVEGGDRRILVVDDEAPVREALSATFQAWGFEVVLAEGGEAAFSLFLSQTERFDLVLTDVSMPGMDGLMLYRKLKEKDPELKILLSSGYKSKTKIEEILSCNVGHFLAKPFSEGQLADVVREILES